jgi:hemoglobin
MVAFWSSVALHSGRYSGKPVPAHARLDELSPALFERWLGLFRETLRDIAPTPAAAEYFIERAERIAASLVMALFGFPRFAETPRPAGQA